LRDAAEAQLTKSPASELSVRSDTELLHELQIHQIELETQNKFLREAQHELEASRDRYADLYDSAPVGYLTLTDKGMIEEINLTATTLLGMKRKDLMQFRFASLVVANDRSRWMTQFLNVLKKGDKRDVEVDIKRRDGTVFPAMLDCNRANFGDGEMAIRIALTDVSERKQAEVALLESEERWKFAIEGAGDGLWDWDIQTGVAFYSARYKEMFGYADADFGITSDEWSKRIHPDDAAGVFAELQPYMDGKPGSASVEFLMLCKDGSWQWTLGRGMVVSRDANDKPSRMIGTNSDITERKQSELAKRASDEQLRAFYELNLVGLAITSPEKGWVRINQCLRKH
jgi:PAS domain S-box-containing protein